MVDISFTMVLQWLNFGVLLFILYNILYKPLVAFLDKRAEEIHSDLEEAKAKNEKAQEILEEYEKKTVAFQKEAETFIENARKDALLERERMVHSANKEVEGIMERGKAEIALELEFAKETLKKEFSSTAVRCAEKILEKQINENDHKEIIDEFLRSEFK